MARSPMKDRHAQFLFRCICIAILSVVFFVTAFLNVVSLVDCPAYACLSPYGDSDVNPVLKTVLRLERHFLHARHRLVGGPELETAMFWLKRTHVVSVRDWYNLNSATLTRLPNATTLPATAQAEGRVIYPLHALYLYAIGGLVRRDAEKLMPDPFQWSALPVNALPVRNSAVFYGGFLMFLTIAIVTLPVLWSFALTIADLLIGGLVGREQRDPTESSPTKTVVSTLSDEQKASLRRRMAFVIALAGFVCGVLPTFVIDISTLHANSLAVTLVLITLHCFVRDELTMHPEHEFTLEQFAMEQPVLEQGTLRFYALKQKISRGPLVLAGLCSAAACMIQSSFIVVAPVLVLWGATSCYQHGFQRVAVMMKGGAAGKELESPMGFSCYRDRLKINEWFAFLSSAVVAVVAVCMAPFCYGKMNFLQFIDLFARPSDERVSTRFSVSGAKEMAPECLTEASAFFTCTRALPNLWRVLEFNGVPLTRVFTNMASPFAKGKNGPSHNERQLWLDYASIVLLVIFHAVPILALLLYRTRKPPLTFDAPATYQSMYAEQQKSYEDYMKQLALRRGQPKAPAGKARGSQPQAPKRPSKTATCISREEYVLKQISMLAWMMLVSVASSTLMLSSPSYMHYTPVMVAVCVLTMLHCAIGYLRWVSPTVFELAWERPISPAAVHGTGAAEATPQPAAPTIADEALEAVPLTTRWCSSSPAAISEKADFTWMLAVLLAVVKSSEILTFQWFPYQAQTVWCLTAALALEMIVTRFWRRVDVVTTFFFFTLQFGAVALMFYAAHDYAQVTRSMPADAPVADRAKAFLHQFVPFTVSRIVPLSSVKSLAPYPSGVVHLSYECAASALLLLGATVHALFRIARLGLGPEELRFVAIEEEMNVLKSKKE